MKNKQQGSLGIMIVIIIALAVIGGGAYFYSTQKTHVDTTDTQINTSSDTSSSNKASMTKGNYSFVDSSGTTFELLIAENNKVHLTMTGIQVYRSFNLVYTVKGERLNFYFDSYDDSDSNANRLEIANELFNKGEELFILDAENDSSYKITWDKPEIWLNNIADKDTSFFKKK